MSTRLVVSVTDELVTELERECRTGADDHAGMGHEEESALFDRIGDFLLALMAERAELKRDAERYRHYRQGMVSPGLLDSNIDSAMQSEAKP